MNTCIIVCGPTAVGKTALALSLAKHFNTSIISADSRQCYRELNIGVAKPTDIELEEVFHYFINSHSIHSPVQAAEFEHYALGAAGEIFSKNNVAIMVGGTGLYIRAFTNGLDVIPSIPGEITADIQRQYEVYGISWLVNELTHSDPLFLEKREQHNPHRMMRALAVWQATGKSILHFQTGKAKMRNFECIKICVSLPREILYKQINQRVDEMMQRGLLEEVAELLPFEKLKPLQTVGYAELFQHLKAQISYQEAVEKIKQHTRNYAKRQITWFRNEPGMLFSSPDKNEAMQLLPAFLQ